jgi:hypothetical protein
MVKVYYEVRYIVKHYPPYKVFTIKSDGPFSKYDEAVKCCKARGVQDLSTDYFVLKIIKEKVYPF